MKRIFALMIALALAACLFAACGDDDVYREPGTGSTVGNTTATTPISNDDNGNYSADPDGEVSQTTDNDGILEDGMNDIESGIEQGIDDVEQGIDDLENGAEDILGGNNNGAGANGNADGANGMNGGIDTNVNGENGAEMNGQNAVGSNTGATNGNSH